MLKSSDPCPCGSTTLFNYCCEPFLLGSSVAKTAQELMRSRFCAYATANYRYILETYTPEKQKALNVEALQLSDKGTQWLKLVIHDHQTDIDNAKVEFSAYYRVEHTYYVLHELSNFRLIESKWYYTDGKIFADSGSVKLARNEPCLCGSGKKYKQCCCSTLIKFDKKISLF